MGQPHGHWKTSTFVAGLTLRGMIAPFVLDGPINRAAFETYVEKVLVPELRTCDIVIMDNLSSYKGARVRESIEAAGRRAPLPAALQSRPQPYRDGLLKAQGPAPQGRRANRGRPVDRDRTYPSNLQTQRMQKLLRRRTV